MSTSCRCLRVLLLWCALLSLGASVFAQDAVIRKTLASRLPDLGSIDSVSKSEVPGLYEVRVNHADIYYTDAAGNFLIQGSVYETRSKRNLTKEVQDKLQTVKFDDLPFKDSFTIVRGNGERQLAVFEDPNCGYCKRLRKVLQGVDNITIYTFMYDILSDDSAVKSRNVWCSPDPAKTWNDWMVNGKPAPDAPSTCMANPHEKIIALGAKLHINGTPAIFFADGSRIPGYVDAAELEKKLSSIK